MKYSVLILSLVGTISVCAQNIFHTYSISGQPEIYDMLVDMDEQVYIATNAGVWKYDIISDQEGSLFDASEGINNLPAYDLSMTPSGNIYVTGGSKSYYHFDAQSEQWNTESASSNVSFNHFSYVYHATNGSKYFGTDNGKVFVQSQGTQTLNEQSQYSNAHSLGYITSISKTSDGGITTLLSTDGIILDIRGFVLPITSASQLPNDSVISGLMYRDISYDGTVAGLYTADFTNGAPPNVFSYNTSNSPLPSNRINSVAAHGDSIYVGTSKGLGILNLLDQSWTIFDETSSNLPSSNIVRLAVSSSGRLWIVSADGSLSTWTTGVGLSEEKVHHSNVRLMNRHLILDDVEDIDKCEVYTTSGLLIASYDSDSNAQKTVSLDLNALPIGLYSVVVTSRDHHIEFEKIYLY